jgi:RecA/RadA recombinase
MKSSPRPNSVKPVSALKLLQQERERQANHPPCLLQHANLALSLGITQLAGPASAGKTQLALTLCADCVIRNQKAVYILVGSNGSHEMGRISHRLRTMLAARSAGNNVSPQTIHEWMSMVYLLCIRNEEDLMDLLHYQLPRLLQLHPTISLVVLDGIANLFRIQDENRPNPWHHRSTTFFQLANACKTLASAHQVPFLVLNEATTRIGNSDGQSHLEPALGLSWAQCVNSTFFVTRGHGTYTPSQSSTTSVSRRILRCIKSPMVPKNAVVEFYIDYRGTVRIK